MAQIQKPDSINKIWSSTGDISLPPEQKIREGWAVEIPPREWFNWLDNKQDLAIAHINQHGIAVWDEVTEYQGQKSYAQDPSTGVVYRCLVTNTGNIPSNSPTFWKKAFLDDDDPLVVNAVPRTRRINAGTGLSGGGDLSADRTLSVNFGTTAGTVTQGNDSRLSNAREWTADTVTQAEAEAGTATTRRAWTAQRVRQAIVAWFNGATTAFTRTILGRSNAAQVRGDLQLGTAAIVNTGTSVGQIPTYGEGAFGLGYYGTIIRDFDDVHIGNGFYRWNTTVTNVPEGFGTFGTAIYTGNATGTTGNHRSRILVDLNADNIGFQRSVNESPWTTPRLLLHTGNTSVDANGIIHNGPTIPSGKVSVTADDVRLTNSREWSAATVTQAEAEAGVATTRRAWTSQRVRQAITAWFNGVSTSFSRTLLSRSNAAQARGDLQLGTASVQNVNTDGLKGTFGDLVRVGDFGIGATQSHFLSTGAPLLNGELGSGFYSTGSAVNLLPSNAMVIHVGGNAGRRGYLRIEDGGEFWIRAASNGPAPTYLPPVWGTEYRVFTTKNFNPDTKVDRTRTIATGAGLTGGGNLADNRTISVNFGTTAGTVAQGNDSRIVNATPNSRVITAGTGLTGGGNLTANRTISLASTHIPLGVGQTWQNVTGSRSRGTTYTNTTGRPIQLYVAGDLNNATVTIGGLVMQANDFNGGAFICLVVPNGSAYRVDAPNYSQGFYWAELR